MGRSYDANGSSEVDSGIEGDEELRALMNTYRRVALGELTVTEAATRLPEHRRDEHLRVLGWVAARDGSTFPRATAETPRPRRETIRALLLRSGLADSWTPRELRIACLLVDGRTYDTCAQELGLGRSTVRGAARAICSKSGVASIDALRRTVALVDSLERGVPMTPLDGTRRNAP